VPIAAGIFLDVFNVFLLVLDLFGGRRDEKATPSTTQTQRTWSSHPPDPRT
jgi:hypothetical protein